MKTKYIFEYKVLSKNGSILKQGKIKVKNKNSLFEAKASLENYLKRKVKGFDSLVITKTEDDVISFFSNMFGF